MKWFENGTEFEGTPAEYLELHGNGGQATQQARKQRVLLNPVHGRAVRCTGSAGSRDFVNAKEAWQYVVGLTGLDVSYSTFCKAAAMRQPIGGVQVEYTQPPRGSRADGAKEPAAAEGQNGGEV